jgi:hypothetical protein
MDVGLETVLRLQKVPAVYMKKSDRKSVIAKSTTHIKDDFENSIVEAAI